MNLSSNDNILINNSNSFNSLNNVKITNKTQRNVIIKLELPTAEPKIQLNVVSKKVFDIEINKEGNYAIDSNKWIATDEIYDKARNTYQSIIDPFTEIPKVYKLESIKDKMYKNRIESVNETVRKPLRSAVSSRYLQHLNKNRTPEYIEDMEDEKKKTKTISIENLTPEEREELELETVINPFLPPKPWVRKTRLDGEVVYVNEETKQVKTSAPGQVWAEKYKNLEKLVPTEDYSGWEYQEDDSEKRKRFRILSEFQKRVTAEIERRTERPNELEQVEDVLFSIVDTICRREAKKEWQEKQEKKKLERSVWHPATKGFRLEPLETIKNAAADDDDEGIPVITDLEFNDDCIVSICGYVISKFRPWNLFIKHENERIKARLIEEAKEVEKQLIRKKPMKEKFQKLIELARENPNEALLYLVEGLRNRALEIPNKIKKTDKKLLYELVKVKTIQGSKDLIKALMNPKIIYNSTNQLINSLYLKLFPPSQDELALQKMIDEMTEKEKNEELERNSNKNLTDIQQGRRKGLGKVVMQDMSPVPVTHPDAVLMKIVLLHEPPPIYEMVPPPKWYDPAIHLKKDLTELIFDLTGKKPLPRRKPPKYRNTRAKLPLYANNLNKKLYNSTHNNNNSNNQLQRKSNYSTNSEEIQQLDHELIQKALSRELSRKSGLNQSLSLNQPLENVNEDDEENENDENNENNEENEENEVDDENIIKEVENEDGDEDEDENSKIKKEQGQNQSKNTPQYNNSNEKIGIDNNGNNENNNVTIPTNTRKRQSINSTQIPNLTSNAVGDDNKKKNRFSHYNNENSINVNDLNKMKTSTSTSTNENALSKYQLSQLTQLIYQNYKDTQIGAAPTVVVKDIFDNSRRKQFEQKLLTELSSAACIPVEFFRIEEIKILPENDKKLWELKKLKDDYFIEQERLIEEKKRKELEEYQFTLELKRRNELLSKQRMEERQLKIEHELELEEQLEHNQQHENQHHNQLDNGSIHQENNDHNNNNDHNDHENQHLDEKSHLSSPHSYKKSNEIIENSTQHSNNNNQPISILEKENNEINNDNLNDLEDEIDNDEYDEEELNKIIGETEEERRARLKASARKKSVWVDQNNLSQSNQSPKSLHSLNMFPDNISTVTSNDYNYNPHHDRSVNNSPLHINHNNLHNNNLYDNNDNNNNNNNNNSPTKKNEVILHGQVVSLEPSKLAPFPQTQLGLTNPEDIIKDPKCWLANELRELTEEERQLKRFKYLQLQHESKKSKLEKLQNELVQIKKKQNELLEICEEFVKPKYEELHSQIHPIKIELTNKIIQYVNQLKVKSEQKYVQDDKKDNNQNDIKENNNVNIGNSKDPEVNEDMVMAVHQQLLNDEKSMLSEIASTSLQKEENIIHNDENDNNNNGTNNNKFNNNNSIENDNNQKNDKNFNKKNIKNDETYQEIKSILNSMCLAVEYQHQNQIQDQQISLQNKSKNSKIIAPYYTNNVIYDIYDEYLEICDEEKRKLNKILNGCEVSIIIHIDDSLKQHIYLRELRSDDISCFLKKQLYEKKSKIYQGKLTSQIIDIQYKLLFQKRVNFNEWEHLWVHFISPVYFRYTTKPSKIEKYNGGQSQGRLKSGLIVVNPIDNFNDIQKTTYMRLPQPTFQEGDESILDYNCDTIGKEIKSKLVIYRPNMSNLTNYDVMKCKRIMNLFYEKYLNEMKYGLVDGTRLRYGQYIALKDYKASQRIYELAKQKKSRDDRNENGDEGQFKPQITKISKEIFDGWMKEAKDEETEALKEARKKALELKEIRRLEAEMRRKYDAQKTWLYGKLFQLNSTISQDLATRIKAIIEENEEMLLRGSSSQATQEERRKADDYRIETKMKLNNEEKNTKIIWETIVKCYHDDKQKDLLYNNSRKSPNLLENQLNSLTSNNLNSIDVDECITLPSGIDQSQYGNGNGNSRPTTPAINPSIPLESLLKYLNLMKIRKTLDDNHQKFLIKKQLKEKERLKKEKRKKQQEKAERLRQQHGLITEIPSQSNNSTDLQHHSEKNELHDDTASITSLESKNPNHSNDNNSLISNNITTTNTNNINNINNTNDNNNGGDDDDDGYSTMSEPLKRFTDNEMEIITHLSWFLNLINHTDFHECLKQFPLTTPGQITKDELIQFAKLNCEVAPIIFRAKEEIRKEHEEIVEQKQSKQQRHRDREKKRKEDDDKEKNNKPEEMTEEMIYQKMLEDGLAEEAARRKKQFKRAEKRRIKREKAWLYAHQHMYVKIKGLIPYCVVCREKIVTDWMENHFVNEKKHIEEFNEGLIKFRELKEDEVRDELEKKYIDDLEVQRLERLKLISGTKLENDDNNDNDSINSSNSENKSQNELSTSKKSILKVSYSQSSFDSYNSSLPTISNSLLTPALKIPNEDNNNNNNNNNNENSTISDNTSKSKKSRNENNRSIKFSDVDSVSIVSESQNIYDNKSLDSEIKDILNNIINQIEKNNNNNNDSTSSINTNSNTNSNSNSKKKQKKSKDSIIINEPVPEYIIKSGLAYFDPNGKKIIPTPMNLTEKPSINDLESDSKDNHTTSSKSQLKSKDDNQQTNSEEKLDEQGDPINMTIYDKHPHEILLKFWNVEFGEKGDFLGYALIPMDILLHPPKGARSFQLESDPQFVKPGKEKIFLHGSVFVKITPLKLADMRINIPPDAPDPHQLLLEKRAQARSNRRAISTQDSTYQDNNNNNKDKDDKDNKDEDVENYYLPHIWRLQIYRATKMTAMNQIEKNSTICEVCWKGSGKKFNEKIFTDGFLTIGETSMKSNTVDPDWRNDPTAIFELPPIWTDLPITNRLESLPKGGWIARNHLEDIEKLNLNSDSKNNTNLNGPLKDSDKINQLLTTIDENGNTNNGSIHNSETNSQHSLQSSAKSKLKQIVSKVRNATILSKHTIVNLEEKIEEKVEMLMLLHKSEELERQCMAREERIIRQSIHEYFQRLEKPFLEDQRFYEREFSNLIQKIREPPSILARARFLMGSPMQGGGNVIMCEDPATQNKLDIISVPILYEEDEEELSRNINHLLGNPHENLIKVIDYSVHQVLGFAYTGHATTNQRIALIVTEKISGITLMEHIEKNWLSFSNKDFLTALLQIVGALVALHRCGMIHRNLHPDAVLFQMKSSLNDNDSDDENENNIITHQESFQSMKSMSVELSNPNLSSDYNNSFSQQDSFSSFPSVSQNQNQNENQQLQQSNQQQKKNSKPLYQLNDFWFFHNPRKINCQFSAGRADWGSRLTSPPEMINHSLITDKSDIWALGICVYMWATKGLSVPMEEHNQLNFERLQTNIPLKWGPWLNSLIKMCLQRNPKFRATSSDIYQFLVISSSKVK